MHGNAGIGPHFSSFKGQIPSDPNISKFRAFDGISGAFHCRLPVPVSNTDGIMQLPLGKESAPANVGCDWLTVAPDEIWMWKSGPATHCGLVYVDM